MSNQIMVDPAGFARTSGKYAGISEVVQAVIGDVAGVSASARSARCVAEATSIDGVVDFIRPVVDELRLMAVVMRERAYWAEIAARDPGSRRHIALMMSSPHAFVFLMASALGGSGGLRELASKWGLRDGNSLLDEEVASITALATLRGTRRFDELTGYLNSVVAREAVELDHLLDKHLMTEQQIRDLQKTFAGLALGRGNALLVKLVDKKIGGAGIGGNAAVGPLLAGVLAGALEYWRLADNPNMTDETRYRRTAAVAATSFATAGALLTGAALCTLITAGFGALACVAGVAVIGAGVNSVVWAPAIEAAYPEDKVVDFGEHQSRSDDAREAAYIRFLQQNVRFSRWLGPEDRSGFDPHASPSELQSRFPEAFRDASEEFHAAHRYPPRDKIDEYYLEESDRQAWHVKSAQIAANRD